jgi:hypothetical protein
MRKIPTTKYIRIRSQETGKIDRPRQTPKRGWLGDCCRGSGATPEVDREERWTERTVIINPASKIPPSPLLLFLLHSSVDLLLLLIYTSSPAVPELSFTGD